MAGKLKLMQVMGAGKPGGAETFYIRMMVALCARDEVDLLPVVRKGSWAAGRLAELGIPHEVAGFGGMFDFRTRSRLGSIAREFGAQVVTAWMNRAASFMPVGNWIRVGRLGGYYDLKYYHKNADYLFANTDDIVAYCVRNGWPEERVTRLDNFIPQPKEGWRKRRGVARMRWGIPSEATVLLMSGRLHKAKGIDVALRAMLGLPADVWLLLAGEGPERGALQALAGQLGVAERVVFAGWQDEVSLAAAAADIWIAPSRHEPLGNTVLDGWAHGLPVVASRTPGPQMLLGESDSLGLLVDVGEWQSLAAAITRLLKDKALGERLATAGKAEFESKFSETVVVEQWLAYYRQLIAHRGGHHG